MESLLPSEIARLVYGYLKEEKCNEAAQSFLEHSPHMVECLRYARQGKIFTTTVAMSTLMDILEEYCAIRRLVSERLQKMPDDTAGQIRRCTTLIEQLRHLLDASKAGQTLLVSITVPPQGNGSQSSNNLQTSALSSRARARLFPNTDRSKRTSTRCQDGNKQQNNKDAEECSSAPYGVPAVEATPLESLPGLADSRSMQMAAKKIREEGEKQMPKTSTPSKSTADLHEPVPSCSFAEESNISTSSPKRKHHSSSKRKCNNPTPIKNQTPAKARWSHAEENDSNESVDFSVLSKALLGNTELHEKLAEKINSVICPTEQNQMDPAPQTIQCDGMDSELNNAIKTIVSRTESDPLFEKLLEELIGPEEEEMTPSPAEMQSESDDAATKVSGEEEIAQSAKANAAKKKSITPGRSQPQMEEEPITEVPLKQRLRSARQRKSDGAPTTVSPGASGKDKKKEATALSLEDQNAAAIQCIVDVNLNCKQGAEKEVASSSTATGSSSITALPAAPGPLQSIVDVSFSCKQGGEKEVVSSSTTTGSSSLTMLPAAPGPSQNIVDVNLNCKPEAEKKVASSSSMAETSRVTTLPAVTGPSQSAVDSAKGVEQKPTGRSAETIVVETSKRPESVRTSDILSASAAMSGITAENDKSYMMFDGNVACIDAGVQLPLSEQFKTQLPQLTAPLLVTMTQPTMAFTIPNPMETASRIATFPGLSTTVPVSSAGKSCTLSEGEIMAMPTVIVCGNDPAVPHLIQPSSAVGNLFTGNNRYIPIAPKGNATILAAPPVETVPMIRNPLTERELQTVISGSSSSTSTRRAKSIPKEKQLNKQSQAVQQSQQEQQSITLYGSGEAVAEVSTALSLPPICFESPEFKKPSPEKENTTKENPETAANKSNLSAISKENKQGSNSTVECLNAEQMSSEANGKTDDKVIKHNVPLSPQLLSLVNISTRNAGSSKQKESPNKGASVATASSSEVSRSTPQTCLSQNRTLGASSKRLSLSTPRRQRNHVRALDFTTPPKSGIGSRRPNTSPKLTDCKRISPQRAEKFKKVVRRTGLFKSPPSITVPTEANPPSEAKGTNDVTDGGSAPPNSNNISEASETEKEDQRPALIKLPENEVPPIATRSPAVKLSGGWDKITGVGLILNESASPENNKSNGETLTNGESSTATDKQSRKEEKPHKQKNTKPKEVIKSAWDADLRSLLSANNNRFLKVSDSTEKKIQKRKGTRISKAAKLKKIAEETESEAKQLEENLRNLDNSKENSANCDNVTDIPNIAADAEGPNNGADEAKKVKTNCDNDSDKSANLRDTNDLKAEKSKMLQETSNTQSSTKIIMDGKLNEKKDSEPSIDVITELDESAQEIESGSCVGKVIQSPTKLNASKRTLVQNKSKRCQNLNMGESENNDNTETLIVRAEESDSEKTGVIATDIPSNAKEPKESQKDSASPSLLLPILEKPLQKPKERIDGPQRDDPPVLDTPRKIDAPITSFWGADMSLIAPITPRIASPSVEDTPLTKLVQERSSMINFSTIQTPSFPPTPNIALTPQSFNSGASDSPTSYATRPTDYSSCSSYYKPSADNENMNEKVLEEVLISECQRIESVAIPSKKEEATIPQEKSQPEKTSEHNDDQENDVIMNVKVVEHETENAVTSTAAAQFDPSLEKSVEEIPSAKEQIPQNELQNIAQTNEPSLSSEPTASSTKKRIRTKSGTSTDAEASRHASKPWKRTLSNIEEKTKEQMIEDHMEDAKLKLFGQNNSSCDEDSSTSESEAEAAENLRYPLRSRGKQNDIVNDKDVEREVKNTVSKPFTEKVDKVPTISEKVAQSDDIHKLKTHVSVHAVSEVTHLTPLASLSSKDSNMCLELEEKKRRTIAKLKGFEISPEVVHKKPVELSPEQHTLTFNIQNVPRSVEALVPKTKLETTPKKALHLSVEAIAERLAREKNALPAPQVKETSMPLEDSSEEFPALRLSTDEELDSEASRPQSHYAMVESRLAALHGENENESLSISAVVSSIPVTDSDLCNDLETPTKSGTDDDDVRQKVESGTNKSRYTKKRLKNLQDGIISPTKDTARTSGKSLHGAQDTPQSCKETWEKEEFAPVEASTAKKMHCKAIVHPNLQAHADESSKCSYNKKTMVDGTLYVEIVYQDDGPKGNPIQVDLSQFEISFADDENKIVKIDTSEFQELFSYYPAIEGQTSKNVKKQSTVIKQKARADIHEAHSQSQNKVHRKSRSPQKERLSGTGEAWNRTQSPSHCVSRGRSSHWPHGRDRESPSPPRWQSRGKYMQSPSRMSRRDSPTSHSSFNVHRRSRSHSMDRRKESPSSYHRRRKPSPPPRNPLPGKQKKSVAMISPLNRLYEELVPRKEKESIKTTRNVSRHMSRSHKIGDREPIKRSRRKEANNAIAEKNTASIAAEQQCTKAKELLHAKDELKTCAVVGSARESSTDDTAIQENQNQARDHYGQSHTLPPKKRKASSDETQACLESKRPRTEVPKDLLKKVDLDHLLDFVHGEKVG